MAAYDDVRFAVDVCAVFCIYRATDIVSVYSDHYCGGDGLSPVQTDVVRKNCKKNLWHSV